MNEDIKELIFRSERLAVLCSKVASSVPAYIEQEVIDSLKDASRTVLLICKRLEKQ